LAEIVVGLVVLALGGAFTYVVNAQRSTQASLTSAGTSIQLLSQDLGNSRQVIQELRQEIRENRVMINQILLNLARISDTTQVTQIEPVEPGVLVEIDPNDLMISLDRRAEFLAQPDEIAIRDLQQDLNIDVRGAELILQFLREPASP
jgi:hypothetical protein